MTLPTKYPNKSKIHKNCLYFLQKYHNIQTGSLCRIALPVEIPVWNNSIGVLKNKIKRFSFKYPLISASDIHRAITLKRARYEPGQMLCFIGVDVEFWYNGEDNLIKSWSDLAENKDNENTKDGSPAETNIVPCEKNEIVCDIWYCFLSKKPVWINYLDIHTLIFNLTVQPTLST